MPLTLLVWALRAYWMAGVAAVAIAAFPCLKAPQGLQEVILAACSRGKTWRLQGSDQTWKRARIQSESLPGKAFLLFKGANVPHRWFTHFYVVGCAFTAFLLVTAWWGSPPVVAGTSMASCARPCLHGAPAPLGTVEPAPGSTVGGTAAPNTAPNTARNTASNTVASSCLAAVLASPIAAAARWLPVSHGAHVPPCADKEGCNHPWTLPSTSSAPSHGEMPACRLPVDACKSNMDSNRLDSGQGKGDGEQRKHAPPPEGKKDEEEMKNEEEKNNEEPLTELLATARRPLQRKSVHIAEGQPPVCVEGARGLAPCVVAPPRVRYLLALFTLNAARHLVECLLVCSFHPSARMHVLGYVVGTSYYVVAPLSLVIDVLAYGPPCAPPGVTGAGGDLAIAAPMVDRPMDDEHASHTHGGSPARVDLGTNASKASGVVKEEHTAGSRHVPDLAPWARWRSALRDLWMSVGMAAADSLPSLLSLVTGTVLFAYGSWQQHICHRILANCRAAKSGRPASYNATARNDVTAEAQRAQATPASRSAAPLPAGASRATRARSRPTAQPHKSRAVPREGGHVDTGVVHAYSIPRGHWFERVSCPHYLAEMVAYVGLLLIAGIRTAVTAWLLLLWVVANLTLGAIHTHQWYQQEFCDYPKNRRAVFPNVL